MNKEATTQDMKLIMYNAPPIGGYLPDYLAEALYAAGYRKLPERPKVLSGDRIAELWREGWTSDKHFGELVAQAALDDAIRHYEGVKDA